MALGQCSRAPALFSLCNDLAEAGAWHETLRREWGHSLTQKQQLLALRSWGKVSSGDQHVAPKW